MSDDGALLLDSADLQGVAKFISNLKSEEIVVMIGAGVSVSAGIPDFRSPKTGLYHNLQKYNLSCAEDIFDIDFFRNNPAPFYMLCKELWPDNFFPTPAHLFIRLLHEKGLLLRCFTQNIDSLEVRAGIPAEKIVAAHGNFDACHTIRSRVGVPVPEFREAILQGEPGWRAMNEKYGGLVKPDIVFFGESLPARFFELSEADLPNAKLLIVMGTSLVVHPFAGLTNQVQSDVPRLLINRDRVGGSVFNFESENNRDVFCEGDCDAGVRNLAKLLGWEQDLAKLVNETEAAKQSAKKGQPNTSTATSTATPTATSSTTHTSEEGTGLVAFFRRLFVGRK